MFNKKTIVITTLAVIVFFASTILVFSLVKRFGNKAKINNTSLSIIDELKSNNPDFSSAQLKFFVDTAAERKIEPCLGRADEGVCISSVAYIIGDTNLCHDLSRDRERLYQGCIAGAVKKTAGVKINQCDSLSGDDYYYCLGLIFDINEASVDCAVLQDSSTRTVCQDFFIYQTAYSKYDRGLCQKIKTEKINQYCLKNIIEKK